MSSTLPPPIPDQVPDASVSALPMLVDVVTAAQAVVTIERGWSTSEGQAMGVTVTALFVALLAIISDLGGTIPTGVREAGVIAIPAACTLLVAAYGVVRSWRKASGVSITRP